MTNKEACFWMFGFAGVLILLVLMIARDARSAQLTVVRDEQVLYLPYQCQNGWYVVGLNDDDDEGHATVTLACEPGDR